MASSTLSEIPMARRNVATTTPETGNDIDIFKGLDGSLWKEYVDKATSFDERMVDEWNKIVDVILLYVGLIISVLTAFIIETTKQFNRNPADITNDLLVAMYKHMIFQVPSSNISVSDFNTTVASIFNLDQADTQTAKLYNGLLYTSLALCIVVSVIALMAKLWLVAYGHRAFSVGTFYDRAIKRQEAYTGVLAWKIGAVINTLPLILLVALVLLGLYVHISVWAAQRAVGFLVGITITSGLIALGISSLAAAFIPACPFHSPLSAFIQFIFQYSEELSGQLLSFLWEDASPKIKRWLRIGAYTLVWLGSSVVVAYAIITYSGSFTSLVCVPIAITFAYTLRETPDKDYKPQRYRIPHLLLLAFISISPFLAGVGYFRNQHPLSLSLPLYILAMLGIVFFGWMATQLSKSMVETAEVDAIAWLLGSTPSQHPTHVENAGKIANSPSGYNYHPRLLESLMPVLSSLIVSYRTDGLSKMEDLETYVSCLARLSAFTDSPGSRWYLMEDAKRHPELENPLYDKLKDLAGANSRYSPQLNKAANEVLKNFGLPLDGQSQKISKFQKRPQGSTTTLIESRHSNEETMELRPRRMNGYYEPVDV